MKLYIYALLLFACSAGAQAQPYWQQHVATRIEVRLDDTAHFLYGYEELTYTNNSPDTLKSLFMHLWPNAYRHDHTPYAVQSDRNKSTAFYYSKVADRGYIDSLDFIIDGENVEHYFAEATPDIARLDLNKALLPGGKIKISTPFKVKLPQVFSRLGHTGQAYYISQWFPKPAVYDAKGWHPISYLDQGEFFSEYGSYDVSITVPKNYVVMATGNCTDKTETDWLDTLANMPMPDKNLYKNEGPVSAAQTKTIHFHEDNVHDFAWFADKRWVVRKDTVLNPGTNTVVTAWTAFWPWYQNSWKDGTEYLKQTVRYYGKWVGPYQYKTIKAVLGDMRAGGGMEYPTVTVIDKSAATTLKTVVIHEAGHNWFYGMLGSNERDHAWMDEGLNTFYEKKTTEATKTDTGIVNKMGQLNEDLLYYELAATRDDQPIDQPSAEFSKLNYGIDVYYKSALMLKLLEQYMGPADFERGMKSYFELWHFKHPYPADFRKCMEAQSKKQLSWFFEGVLNTGTRMDFTITDAKVKDGKTEVTVRNNSRLVAPVMVEAYNGDSMIAEAWTEPFAQNTTINLPVTEWTKLKISKFAPDAKSTNDVYRRKSMFHRFGLEVKPLLGLNTGEKDRVFIAPALRYNTYDGFMLGAILHNLTLPENRFRFALVPMFSFATTSLVGAGSVGYIWYPDNFFKEVLLQVDGKSFHYADTKLADGNVLSQRFTKFAPSLNLRLNEYDQQSTITRTLTLKAYHVSEQTAETGVSGKPYNVTTDNVYELLRYQHRNDRSYNPFRYQVEGQMGANFAKINIEGNARVDYHVKNKALHVRGYVGKFFGMGSDPAAYNRYLLNAGYSAVNDYLYDGTYFGRSATSKLAAQQISVLEGGFKIPVRNGVYRSDDWMAAVNLSTDLPLKWLPLRLFFDAGLTPNFNPTTSNNKATTLLYDGGLELVLIDEMISVYMPVIMSGDFRDYLTNTYGRKNVFGRSISFTFHLHNVNWLKSPTKLLSAVVN